MAAYFSLTANTTHALVPVTGEEQPTILMTVTHTDGRVAAYLITVDQLFSSDCDFEDVFKCTHTMPGGCTVTAETCDEARTGFRACACKGGIAFFC